MKFDFVKGTGVVILLTLLAKLGGPDWFLGVSFLSSDHVKRVNVV